MRARTMLQPLRTKPRNQWPRALTASSTANTTVRQKLICGGSVVLGSPHSRPTLPETVPGMPSGLYTSIPSNAQHICQGASSKLIRNAGHPPTLEVLQLSCMQMRSQTGVCALA